MSGWRRNGGEGISVVVGGGDTVRQIFHISILVLPGVIK